MKKKYFVLFSVFFFLFITNVKADSQCPLADNKMWDYINSRTATRNISTEDSSQKIVCCTPGNSEIWWCDYYSPTALNSGISTGENNDPANNSNTTTTVNYCVGLASTFVFIGHIVRLAKILIPIIIIGFGMLDFFKAVVASKDDEIKKSIKSLIFRAISGVCIFFLPMFIDLIFSWVSGWSESYEAPYKECFKCIWDVGSCTK